MKRTITALSLAIVVGAAGPALATGPKGKVTPNTLLANDQVLIVTGKHFSAGENVYIVECNSSVMTTGIDACNTQSDIGGATTTRKGLVPATTYTVLTGVIGNGSCGTSRADRKCYIAISNSSINQNALVEVFFAVP